MKKYVVAFDQGTTSSRAVLFDQKLQPVAMSQRELRQHYPKPGWVEHDPMEIYAGQMGALTELLAQNGVRGDELFAIGITNQRETTVVWEKVTGRPLTNAIVWQCRRTAPMCREIQNDRALTEHIQSATGLLPDAYFSATKLRWILDHNPGARDRARRGELLFGTVDSWLLYRLTGGKAHVTDRTNASRTMLYNIDKLCWDKDICEALEIPVEMLPQVLPSGSMFGEAQVDGALVPVCGVAGDQQAALFGQGCWETGQVKNTYGTGCFLLMNTGKKLCRSNHGLLTTLAASPDNSPQYALEGSVFIGGAAVQWLRDELGIIARAEETQALAMSVQDNGGVYMVPAFTGLGAPYWDMNARGAFFGLTRGAGKAHLVRAVLEAIAYQCDDVISAMERDTGVLLTELKVDGGASANDFLMQFQADIGNRTILRPGMRETTALGAAALAGMGAGVWNTGDLIKLTKPERRFEPAMTEGNRRLLLSGWHKAVDRARAWEEN